MGSGDLAVKASVESTKESQEKLNQVGRSFFVLFSLLVSAQNLISYVGPNVICDM